jgi:hypothetical protein
MCVTHSLLARLAAFVAVTITISLLSVAWYSLVLAYQYFRGTYCIQHLS